MRTSFRVERPPRAFLARHVSSVWIERSARADPLLPEVAVELVWSGRGLFVRGADTRAHSVSAFPEQTFVAIRFRPGAAVDVLGLGGPELTDARIGISALWGRAEMERLESQLAAATPVEAAGLLEDVVEERVRKAPDPAVEAAVRLLGTGVASVSSVADRIGLSERQLFRRCVAALGYGPKTLDRILRFQRFLALARRGPELGLARLAAEAGYADQPASDARVRSARGRPAGRPPPRPIRSRRAVPPGATVRQMSDNNIWSDSWEPFDDWPGGGGQAKRLPRGPNLGASLYELGPGNFNVYHFHHAAEELMVVLRGRPTLRTGAGTRRLDEGDVVHFPVGPDGAHGVTNETEGPVRILMVSTLQSPEVVEYPDLGQITAQARTGSQTGGRLWLIHDVEPPSSG